MTSEDYESEIEIMEEVKKGIEVKKLKEFTEQFPKAVQLKVFFFKDKITPNKSEQYGTETYTFRPIHVLAVRSAKDFTHYKYTAPECECYLRINKSKAHTITGDSVRVGYLLIDTKEKSFENISTNAQHPSHAAKLTKWKSRWILKMRK
jgi:hypothetical protein